MNDAIRSCVDSPNSEGNLFTAPAASSLKQILRISIIHKVEAVACQIIICLLNMQLFGSTSEFMVTRRRLLITP